MPATPRMSAMGRKRPLAGQFFAVLQRAGCAPSWRMSPFSSQQSPPNPQVFETSPSLRTFAKVRPTRVRIRERRTVNFRNLREARASHWVTGECAAPNAGEFVQLVYFRSGQILQALARVSARTRVEGTTFTTSEHGRRHCDRRSRGNPVGRSGVACSAIHWIACARHSSLRSR
jgi:hypothetical protein